ncbi:conserved hypothetical protein [Methanothermobacter sp. MT-2]|nr:conserved hypothetical protein [Methanothermobacter sp. MT-2]HHW05855.1 ArsR family transcriptional regulator [Methanothermobacter sp.]
MKTLITNLRGRCLFDVTMRNKIDGLILVQSEKFDDLSLEKFVKGGLIKIETEDPLKACYKMCEVIRGAKKHGEVYVAYNGDDLGGLLALAAFKEGVDAIFTCFRETSVRLPIPRLDISDSKLRILEVLEDENLTAVEIAKRVGVSRAMVYKHLSDLIEMGLVKQSHLLEKYSITKAGKFVTI